MGNLSPQLRTMIKHLLICGEITNVEANAVYCIRSVSSRISELTKMGFSFVKQIKRDLKGQRYTKYIAVFIPAPYRYMKAA